MNGLFWNPRSVLNETTGSARRLARLEDGRRRKYDHMSPSRWRHLGNAVLRARRDFLMMREIAAEACFEPETA
jgi:hypothetical protein